MVVHNKGVLVVPLLFFLLIPSKLFSQPLAKNKTKFVGNIYRSGLTLSQFTKYWNQVTPENAGKWGSVEASRNSYNWTTLDNAYNFARANGFPYRHHTLIWGQQQPSWMTDGSLDSASQRAEIEEWIRLAGERYPDADFVDVVNEPLPGHAPPVYKNALGGDGVTGWDWVITSFELARQYWPNAELHLNDYNIINSSSATAQYLQIINLLKDRGLIDGIGVQCHSFEVSATPTATLQANLNSLAATGLPIYITEFDINDANDNSQLEKYRTIFPLLYEHPGVKGITLWGYVLGEIWQTNAYLLTDRLVERPALVWLRNYLAAPLRPALISPVTVTNTARNPVLIWSSSESATFYRVQLATNSVFTTVDLDSTVTDTLLQVAPLAANTRYYWRVSAGNQQAIGEFSQTASFITGDQIVSTEDIGDIPHRFALYQNYPNPFNPATTIRYDVPKDAHVTIVIHDLLGRSVATLVDGVHTAKSYAVQWSASGVASGVYFYRMYARTVDAMEDFVTVRRLLLLR